MTPGLPLTEAVSVSPSDRIELSDTDRSRLHTCVHTGRTTAHVCTRAQVLLKLREGWSLAEVCRGSTSYLFATLSSQTAAPISSPLPSPS